MSQCGPKTTTDRQPSAATTTDGAFRAWHDAFEKRLVPVASQYELAWWTAALSGNKADFERMAELDLAAKQIFADPTTHAALVGFRNADPPVSDPIMKRALDVAFWKAEENRIPPVLLKDMVDEAAALEQMFNTFRAQVGGKEISANRIREVLAESNDSAERQRYWQASKEVGLLVGPRLVSLVKKRNEAARAAGYRNFYEMRLKVREQEPAEIAAIFEDLDRRTAPLFERAKAVLDEHLAARFGVKAADLQPWHYADVFFQESPGVGGLDLDALFAPIDPRDVCSRFYESIGLPAVRDILSRSDLYEKPGKVEHAFCTHIDRRGDVRVLANLRNDERWTGTLLHELGHGVYEAYLDAALPYLLRSPAHEFTTEGVAEMFGALTRDPQWLAAYTTLPPEMQRQLATLARSDMRLDRLIFARWSLVMVHFERALYENPDQDLEQTWWQLVSRYQRLRPPADLAGRADWAAKIHVVTVPAYYHNYMLGRLFAEQLRQRIEQQVPAAMVGGAFQWVGHPEIGRFLIDNVFSPALRYRWDELVRRATGAPLSAAAFLSSL